VVWRLCINLTPCIPLSLKGEGEERKKRGASLSLQNVSPFPFRGRGIKKGDKGGWGYHIKLKRVP
jgi:hypothetical protein